MYSLVLDGGISYLLMRGLRNLFGSKTVQKDPYTEGYQRALLDMQRAQQITHAPTPKQENEQQQTYGKGNSR